MNETSLAVLYLVAAVLFILSLGGLSNQETARRGNTWGIVGMAIALVGTLLHPRVESYGLVGTAILGGAVIGAILAIRVVMTAMPQLVAMLHSFVGLAAVLVGIASYLSPEESIAAGGRAAIVVHEIEIWVGVAIGAITFTGSVIAWGKLRGSIGGNPLLLPGRHAFNLVMVTAVVVMAVLFVSEQTSHEMEVVRFVCQTPSDCLRRRQLPQSPNRSRSAVRWCSRNPSAGAFPPAVVLQRRTCRRN